MIEALEAVNKTLLQDIESAEFDYQFAFGGDTNTINLYRRKYGALGTTEEFFRLPGITDESTQNLVTDFYKDQK